MTTYKTIKKNKNILEDLENLKKDEEKLSDEINEKNSL